MMNRAEFDLLVSSLESLKDKMTVNEYQAVERLLEELEELRGDFYYYKQEVKNMIGFVVPHLNRFLKDDQ